MTVSEALLTLVLFLGASVSAALYCIAAPFVRDARARLRRLP